MFSLQCYFSSRVNLGLELCFFISFSFSFFSFLGFFCLLGFCCLSLHLDGKGGSSSNGMFVLENEP